MDSGLRLEILIRRRVLDRYELTEGNWHTFSNAGNCYMPCPEMGIRDCASGEFTLFQHGCRDHGAIVDRVAAKLENGWTPERIVHSWDDEAGEWEDAPAGEEKRDA